MKGPRRHLPWALAVIAAIAPRAGATNNYRLMNGGFEDGPTQGQDDVHGPQWVTPHWLVVNFGADQRVEVQVERSSPLAGSAALRLVIQPSAMGPALVEIRQRVFNLALFPRDLHAEAAVRASAPGIVSLVLDEGMRRTESALNARRAEWDILQNQMPLRANRIKYTVILVIRPPPEGAVVDFDGVRAWSPERERIDGWLQRIYRRLRRLVLFSSS